MPQDFRKNIKLKQGNIKNRVRGNSIAMIWKEKGDRNMLTNMHHLSAEGHFCHQHVNTLKPATTQNYNRLSWGVWTRVTT
jgi:hypothetical protein